MMLWNWAELFTPIYYYKLGYSAISSSRKPCVVYGTSLKIQAIVIVSLPHSFKTLSHADIIILPFSYSFIFSVCIYALLSGSASVHNILTITLHFCVHQSEMWNRWPECNYASPICYFLFLSIIYFFYIVHFCSSLQGYISMGNLKKNIELKLFSYLYLLNKFNLLYIKHNNEKYCLSFFYTVIADLFSYFKLYYY